MNIIGKTIGSCVINEYLILFTTDSSSDRIYKIKPPNDSGVSDVVKLAELDLNFNESNKIQTLPFYENESVQKVYWIDGLNQPRVINIAVDDSRIYSYTNTSFDFIQNLKLEEFATIEKLYNTGYFKSGVIQYAATYFNKNGAESNIFWISNINYVSLDDRAGKPDEIVQNAFKISLSNLEDKYEYVRLYSIYRTSLDTTPEVRIITDLKIPTSKAIAHTDAGNSGSIIDTTLLLYVGGEELVPQCMSQKNNTLFLGNISLPSNDALPATLVTNGDVVATGVPPHASTFKWTTKTIILEDLNSGNSMYPYKPFVSNIKHFKFDETYRLGIQGQFGNGKWSTPIWLGNDHKVDVRYNTRYLNNLQIELDYVNGRYEIADELSSWLASVGFKRIRPVMVPLSYSDRTVIAQGLVNNTLGIIKNRHDGITSQPFSYPDYIFRCNGKNKTTTSSFPNGSYAHFDLLKVNNNLSPSDGFDSYRHIEIMGNCGLGPTHDLSQFDEESNDDFFFVDKNLVNFWSPDFQNNHEILSQYINQVSSVGLYGFSFQSAINSNMVVDYGSINEDDYSNTEDYYPALLPNYSSWLMNGYKGRRLFPLIKGEPISSNSRDHKSYHTIPIWSPENYKIVLPRRSVNYNSESVDINFTIFNKSSYNYFGANMTLNNSYSNYKYDINKPSLLVGDSMSFIEGNYVDNPSNSGSVIYSKNVNKVYPSNTYFNTIRYEKDTVDYTDGLRYTGFLSGYGDDETEHPVRSGMYVKYNTANHAIFSFKIRNSKYACLPRLQNIGETNLTEELFNNPQFYRQSGDGFRVDVLSRSVLKDAFDPNSDITKNSVPIFDLYKSVSDDVRYGGKSPQAIYNNAWIPCGDTVSVVDGGMVVEYSIGDTYIGRFDVLRVFPNDTSQVVQHTEIVSFICESFINPDGRSDVNRYNTDSSLMTPANYGLFNSIYSQKDNYFTYNILDPDLFNTNDYSNTIAWSKTKTAGEKTDTWTNINMLSSIDLDGVYGEVSSINLFNNDLYAFQPKGIARLLFNERIQQQASDGVSVELTNGYKVPEYRYLTNQYGASNKWSIIEGKQGIYFIDYINKSLISIGDGIKDLGLSLGFKSWFNENTFNKNYNLSYDRINNDLYIHDENNCLNYSETLGTFVSFFDYVNVPQMKNVWDSFVSISYSDLQGTVGQLTSENGLHYLNDEAGNSLVSENSDLNRSMVWLHNKGSYNEFYGNQKPFSIEYLFNPDPLNDKVFNTFEYRLNDQFIDFNGLEITNWYQYGELNDRQYANSLKRKFNVNRVQLPRQSKTLNNNTGLIDLDTRNSLNRIRSTWAKLKLSHNVTDTNINKKFSMQDLTVTYTI